MRLGQLLGGAGVVARSTREEQDAQRRSQQLRLQTEEMTTEADRLARLRAGFDRDVSQPLPPWSPTSPGEQMGTTQAQAPQAGLQGTGATVYAAPPAAPITRQQIPAETTAPAPAPAPEPRRVGRGAAAARVRDDRVRVQEAEQAWAAYEATLPAIRVGRAGANARSARAAEKRRFVENYGREAPAPAAGLALPQTEAPAPAPAPAPVQPSAQAGLTIPQVAQEQPQPQQPQQQAGLGATAAQEVVPDSARYLANPQGLSIEMQRTLRKRDELERMSQIYAQAGYGQEAFMMRSQLKDLDDSMVYLEGMQGIMEFRQLNDPRRLAGVWSKYALVPIGIQPRNDGTFNIVVNGNIVQQGVSASDVVDTAQSAFDATYREQKAEAIATQNALRFESMLKNEETMTKENAAMIRETAVETVRGEYTLNLEVLRRRGFDVKFSGREDGSAIIFPPDGGVPLYFNPDGREVPGIDGVPVKVLSAMQIPGLERWTQMMEMVRDIPSLRKDR